MASDSYSSPHDDKPEINLKTFRPLPSFGAYFRLQSLARTSNFIILNFNWCLIKNI